MSRHRSEGFRRRLLPAKRLREAGCFLAARKRMPVPALWAWTEKIREKTEAHLWAKQPASKRKPRYWKVARPDWYRWPWLEDHGSYSQSRRERERPRPRFRPGRPESDGRGGPKPP